MLGVVVLALIAAVQGQTMPGMMEEHPICCFDKTFSAVIGEIGATFGQDKEKLLDGVSVVGYDFYNKHSASETYFRGPNGTRIPVFELRDYKTNMHYRKVGNGTCTKEPLKRGYMFPPCIPGNATKISETSLGYSGVGQTVHQNHHHHDGNHSHTFNMTFWQQMHGPNPPFTYNQTRHHHSRLGVQFYEFDVPSVDGEGGRMKLGVTRHNCIPVIEIFTGTVNGSFFEMNMFFSNYKPGIEDMSTFDLPSDCASA